MYAGSALFKFMLLSATTGERPQQTPADPAAWQSPAPASAALGSPPCKPGGIQVRRFGRQPLPRAHREAAQGFWGREWGHGGQRRCARARSGSSPAGGTKGARPGSALPRPNRGESGSPAAGTGRASGHVRCPPRGALRALPAAPRHRGRTTSLPTGMVLRPFIPPENLSRRTEGDPGCGAAGRPTPLPAASSPPKSAAPAPQPPAPPTAPGRYGGTHRPSAPREGPGLRQARQSPMDTRGSTAIEPRGAARALPLHSQDPDGGEEGGCGAKGPARNDAQLLLCLSVGSARFLPVTSYPRDGCKGRGGSISLRMSRQPPGCAGGVLFPSPNFTQEDEAERKGPGGAA